MCRQPQLILSLATLLPALWSVSCFAEKYILPQYQLPNYFLYDVPKKAKPPPGPQKRIVMYSSNYCNKCETEETCKPCARAKALFEARGLKYEEYNISESQLYFKQYQRLGSGILPVLFINGKRMNGFRRGLFDETYEEAPEKWRPYKPPGPTP